MKKLLFFAAAIAFAALTACSGGGKKNGSTDSTKSKDSTSAKAPVGTGMYKMKSGIIEQTMTEMGMTSNITTWFDDYGNKRATETKTDMGMVKMDKMNLVKEGYDYSFDVIKKTGTKTKIPAMGDNKNINFNNLSDEMMKQMKISKLGTEVVMGKTCDKYSMDDATMKTKSTFCVWNGIPMKTEMEVMGMKVTTITNKLEENASVPADKFEIPADVKITDLGK